MIALPLAYANNEGSKAFLPIGQKSYQLDENIKELEFCIFAGKEISEQNISRNLQTVIRIQNNQTEILVYICKILFEGIIEPTKGQLEEFSKLKKQLGEINNKIVQILGKI